MMSRIGPVPAGKGVGKTCVVGRAVCQIYESFSAGQKKMLATPIYKLQKEKKSWA